MHAYHLCQCCILTKLQDFLPSTVVTVGKRTNKNPRDRHLQKTSARVTRSHAKKTRFATFKWPSFCNNSTAACFTFKKGGTRRGRSLFSRY